MNARDAAAVALIATFVLAGCEARPYANGATPPPHRDAAVAHTATSSCATGACHAADVTAIHQGTVASCEACHAAGVTPTTSCASCHAVPHSNMAASHATPAGCGTSGCHAADVSTIHAETAAGCDACHGAGVTPSTGCASCHSSYHAAMAMRHAATAACTSCHGTDVSAVHQVTASACQACHAPGVVPSTDCRACHEGAHGVREPYGACRSCHDMFDQATARGHGGEHSGIACSTCHGASAQGCVRCHDGEVHREHHFACDTCHTSLVH